MLPRPRITAIAAGAQARSSSGRCLLGAVLVAAAGLGCGSKGAPAASEADASDSSEVAEARRLVGGQEAFPARARVAALARAMQARAAREGAGARARDLAGLAGRLFERSWRVGGDMHDQTDGLMALRAASGGPGSDPTACLAGLRAARLAGDAAGDASLTYREVFQARRRVGPRKDDAAAPCVDAMDRVLAFLAAFRPSEADLDGTTIDAVPPSATPAVGPPRVVRIEAWPARDSARVVVVLDREAAYRTGDDVAPGSSAPRTSVDLDGVDRGDAPPATSEPGIVRTIRAEATTTGTRVSLELDGQAWRRTFYMREPYRIVVDVARHPPNAYAPIRAVSRVVLDPGHGGKDVGAVGPGGSFEKDVTLDIARRAGRILTSQGVDVLLTRPDDRFVSLEERTALANAFSADLFISVHCNASDGGARRGVETYVLDTTRDEVAARIAARENATTQASSRDLVGMLRSMRLADQAARSTRFANLLQRSALAALALKYDGTPDGGVHPAGFYVLVGARMPGVLLETSYISNAVDEARLGTSEYRQLLADAIVNAVKAYREGR